MTEAQRQAVRAYQEAAESRLQVARDVRGPSQTPVALELYRQAALFYALAFLLSKDRDLDAAALTSEAVFQKLDQALAADGARPSPDLASVKALLIKADPLELHRMPAEEADQMARDLEAATSWLSRRADARSSRDLKMARVTRLAAAGVWAVALVVLLVVWIVSPKNLAKGKNAASSSTMFGTTPAGAVDGSKSGQYGFHSSQEDSPWLSIDLGRRYAIATLKVYGRGDGYYDQSIPLVLEVADDDASYRPVATRAEPFSADDPWVIRPTGLVARFVRLRTMRRSYLVLGEVEVFGRKSK